MFKTQATNLQGETIMVCRHADTVFRLETAMPLKNGTIQGMVLLAIGQHNARLLNELAEAEFHSRHISLSLVSDPRPVGPSPTPALCGGGGGRSGPPSISVTN